VHHKATIVEQQRADQSRSGKEVVRLSSKKLSSSGFTSTVNPDVPALV
jgi:hypothetical protein